MSTMKPRGEAVNINGEERRLIFTLNAVDTLQSDYGETLREIIQRLTSEETSVETLVHIIKVLLDDERDREKFFNNKELKDITEKEIKWAIGYDNQVEILQAIFKAYGLSFPEPDEDDDPNQTSGHRSN